MGRPWRVLAAVVIGLTLCVSSASAAAPARLFQYTKQTSLSPGTYDFTFALYASTTAPTALWSSGKVSLRLRTPLLVYTLGSGAVKIPASIDFSQQLFIRVVKTSGPDVVIANRERLPVSPYAQFGAAAPPMSTPIVLGESAGGWRTASSSAPVTFEVLGPDAFLSGNPTSAVAFSLPLTHPALVGGTTYRLASIEYCVRMINAANSKVDSASIFSDTYTGSIPLANEITDSTDRTAVGCYEVIAPDGTARSYALVLSVALVNGATSGGVIVSGVRSTWVPAAPLAPAQVKPSKLDPTWIIPRSLREQLGF